MGERTLVRRNNTVNRIVHHRMSLSKASTRIGLFALLLSVIVLSLFGSLLAADRTLSAADHESLVLDAHGAALVAERELRMQAELLTELFGPLLPSRAGSRDSTSAPAAFDAVWVVDARGRVAWRGAPRGPVAADTAVVLAAARDV